MAPMRKAFGFLLLVIVLQLVFGLVTMLGPLLAVAWPLIPLAIVIVLYLKYSSKERNT